MLVTTNATLRSHSDPKCNYYGFPAASLNNSAHTLPSPFGGYSFCLETLKWIFLICQGHWGKNKQTSPELRATIHLPQGLGGMRKPPIRGGQPGRPLGARRSPLRRVFCERPAGRGHPGSAASRANALALISQYLRLRESCRAKLMREGRQSLKRGGEPSENKGGLSRLFLSAGFSLPFSSHFFPELCFEANLPKDSFLSLRVHV